MYSLVVITLDKSVPVHWLRREWDANLAGEVHLASGDCRIQNWARIGVRMVWTRCVNGSQWRGIWQSPAASKTGAFWNLCKDEKQTVSSSDFPPVYTVGPRLPVVLPPSPWPGRMRNGWDPVLILSCD